MLKPTYTGHHKDPEMMENYFKIFRYMSTYPREILEIGTLYGGSLRLWNDLFLPDRIIGLDNCPVVTDFPDLPIEVQFFDQKWPEKNNLTGEFDLIIDDGCHVKEFTINTLFELWKFLAPGGTYIIEDWPHYEMEDIVNCMPDITNKLNADYIVLSNTVTLFK